MFEVWLQMSDTNIDRENPSDLPALLMRISNMYIRNNQSKRKIIRHESSHSHILNFILVGKILLENPTNSVNSYIFMNINELVGICLQV